MKLFCKHDWYENYMLINHRGRVGAEHLCLRCGKRKWERITAAEHKRRQRGFIKLTDNPSWDLT